MRNAVLLFISILATTAFGANSGIRIFSCKVVSFDRTEVKGHCDPENPKRIMKIPRQWLSSANENLKVNTLIHVPLDADQLKKWLAMNKNNGASK